MKKDTKYLKWEKDRLTIYLHNETNDKIFCTKNTIIYHTSGGYSGFCIYDSYEEKYVYFNSKTGKQLALHLRPVSPNIFLYVYKINFD